MQNVKVIIHKSDINIATENRIPLRDTIKRKYVMKYILYVVLLNFVYCLLEDYVYYINIIFESLQNKLFISQNTDNLSG